MFNFRAKKAVILKFRSLEIKFQISVECFGETNKNNVERLHADSAAMQCTAMVSLIKKPM